MFGNGTKVVPERVAAPAQMPMGGAARRFASGGSVAILLAGIALNVGWVAFLAWGSFLTVRWLFA